MRSISPITTSPQHFPPANVENPQSCHGPVFAPVNFARVPCSVVVRRHLSALFPRPVRTNWGRQLSEQYLPRMRVLPSLVCLATSALAFVPPVPTPTTHDKPPTAAEVAVKGVQKLLLVPALLGGFAGVSGSFIAPTPAYAGRYGLECPPTRHAHGRPSVRVVTVQKAVCKEWVWSNLPLFTHTRGCACVPSRVDSPLLLV